MQCLSSAPDALSEWFYHWSSPLRGQIGSAPCSVPDYLSSGLPGRDTGLGVLCLAAKCSLYPISQKSRMGWKGVRFSAVFLSHCSVGTTNTRSVTGIVFFWHLYYLKGVTIQHASTTLHPFHIPPISQPTSSLFWLLCRWNCIVHVTSNISQCGVFFQWCTGVHSTSAGERLCQWWCRCAGIPPWLDWAVCANKTFCLFPWFSFIVTVKEKVEASCFALWFKSTFLKSSE